MPLPVITTQAQPHVESHEGTRIVATYDLKTGQGKLILREFNAARQRWVFRGQRSGQARDLLSHDADAFYDGDWQIEIVGGGDGELFVRTVP